MFLLNFENCGEEVALVAALKMACVPLKVVPLAEIPGSICCVVSVIFDQLLCLVLLIRVHHADVIIPEFVS